MENNANLESDPDQWKHNNHNHNDKRWLLRRRFVLSGGHTNLFGSASVTWWLSRNVRVTNITLLGLPYVPPRPYYSPCYLTRHISEVRNKGVRLWGWYLLYFFLWSTLIKAPHDRWISQIHRGNHGKQAGKCLPTDKTYRSYEAKKRCMYSLIRLT